MSFDLSDLYEPLCGFYRHFRCLSGLVAAPAGECNEPGLSFAGRLRRVQQFLDSCIDSADPFNNSSCGSVCFDGEEDPECLRYQ